VPDERCATDVYEIDRATCLWLLSTEQVGHLVETGSEPTVMPVEYVVIEGAVLVRVAGSCATACLGESAVGLEVDMIDVFSQFGWTVRLHGKIEDVTDAALTRRDVSERRRLSWPGAEDRWLRITIGDVAGRWFRAAEQPSALSTAGHL
jgi:hypothetical protein